MQNLDGKMQNNKVYKFINKIKNQENYLEKLFEMLKKIFNFGFGPYSLSTCAEIILFYS
jgi:hypothetical protein